MIILNKGSLTQTGRFAPETMALNLNERGSTATITFGIGTADLAIGDWLQDDTDPGAGIVWRVKTIDTQYNTKTVTVQLEDMVNSLNDQLLNGEIKPSDIAGGSATTCTARQAVEYILNRQSVWELDDFDYDSVSNPYNFNGDSLKAALDTVSSSLEEPVWSYDFTAYPFKISITHLSDDIDSEMRMSRNISTLKVSIDRTRMYTRFYPIGKNNLRLDAPGYAEKNVSTYGVIEKTETDETKDTKAKLLSWAQDNLDKHAEPIVTATVTGLDLSAETGVSLDSFTIGKKCRMPLPEFYTTITEKVIKLSWKDKLAEPENVTVTMANQKEDIASIINRINSSSGRGGRAKAKDDEEDHAWIVDTNDHVSLVAEAVAGKDGEGNPNWSRVAELTVDGNGIAARVTETEDGLVTLHSAIEQTSTQIYITVENAKSDLQSYIDVTAEGIEIASAAASSTMYSVIETTATNISSEVVRRTRVFVQLTDPALVPSNNVREGDIWVKSIKMQTWSEMSSKTWESSADFNWNQYSGSPQFVWDGTKWEPLGDQGAVVEYGTRIEQTERNISLIARAIGTIDPSAIAEIDISAEAIQSAVSTAKSELYSIVRQTATNITSEVMNDIEDIASYIEQTASDIRQTVARKNRVFVQLTDPVYNTGVTVIDGDIWIKSAGNDNVKQTWGELSAKTWNSQNSTNWREYYEGYWYVRKNNKWEIMNANADVVEIGTMLEQDEKHIALIARDVDANHQELGARLEVTAREIRGEVHAAKSSLYTTISQTATSIRLEVVSTKSELSSSITQTASSIRSEVNASKSTIYSSITQTASQIRAVVSNVQAGLQSQITQNAGNIELKVSKNGVISSINQTPESITINASKINLNGYVTATNFSTVLANLASAHINKLYVDTNIYAPNGLSIYANGVWQLSLSQSGNTYTLKETKLNGDERTVGTFSRAVSSWTWGGGNGKINVTALPQNQTKSVSVSIDGQNTITSNGTYTYTVDYENSDGDDVSTGATKTVTVSNPYKPTALTQSVKDAGSVSGYTKHGSSYQTFYYNGSSGSRNIRVYTYPTITIDGVSRNLNDYNLSDFLGGSPTAIYDFGYSEGRGSVSYTPTALTQSAKDVGSVSGYTKHGSDYQAFYYNGSSGSRNIRVYTYPTITIDGVSRNLNDYSLSDYLSGSPTAVYDFGYDEGHEKGILDYRSNTSGWWKKPQDNSGVCTIPNDTNSGSETWFSMNKMSMTRAKTYRSSSGQDSYYGKLYYWDDDVEEYVAASGSNAYWYYSQTNRSGTNSVYY